MISASSVENSPENIEKELNPEDSILNKPKEDELFIMVPPEMNDLTEKSEQEIVIPQTQTGKEYIEKC